MKLIEVVVLLGAHCISPVQQTPAVTEVGKVQCAVMVEQDTDAGTISVTPRDAAGRPEVAAVVARLQNVPPALSPVGSSIEPTSAPPSSTMPPRPLAPLQRTFIPVPPPLPVETDQQPPSADAAAGPETPPASRMATIAPEEKELPKLLPKKKAKAAKLQKPEPARKKASAPLRKKKGPSVTKKTTIQVKKASAEVKERKAAPARRTLQKTAQCTAPATPQWYTTAGGQGKYRCIVGLR